MADYKDLYHRAVTQIEALESERTNMAARQRNREAAQKVVEDLARDLCEIILANEPAEMVLGEPYSWASQSTAELLRKATDALKRQNRERQIMLTRAMRDAEETRKKLAGLQAGGAAEEANGGAKDAAPPKGADAQGQKTEGYKEGDYVDGIIGPWDDALHIRREPDEGMSTEENALLDRAAQEIEQARVTPHGSVVERNGQEIREGARRRADAIVRAQDVRIEKYAGLKERNWDIFKVIGDSGEAREQRIRRRYIEQLAKAGDAKAIVTKTTVSSALQQLVVSGLLRMDKVSSLRGTSKVYRLSNEGLAVYFKKYGKQATASEPQRLESAHDNLIHGYAILYLAEDLGGRKDVRQAIWDTRRRRVRTQDGREAIPDIIVETREKTSMCIEVELGTTEQSSFNDKVGKWVTARRECNIVVQNRNLTEKIIAQVDKWRESLPVAGDWKVRVSEHKHLVCTPYPIEADAAWHYIFHAKAGKWVQNSAVADEEEEASDEDGAD